MEIFVHLNFAKIAKKNQVKMIEIKISQGAKPGHGGMLLAPKVTKEIAETRESQLEKIVYHHLNTRNFRTQIN